MKTYEKPEIILMKNASEGVYLASGSAEADDKNSEDNTRRCRFGRENANQGADKCQVCSATGGIRDQVLSGEHYFKEDYKGCPDHMPEKE